MVHVLDIFGTQHSATTKKSSNKHRAKVPVYKPSSSKQRTKMVTKKSSVHFKKDSMYRNNSKSVKENSSVQAGRKRPFHGQQNAGKRKKRKI